MSDVRDPETTDEVVDESAAAETEAAAPDAAGVEAAEESEPAAGSDDVNEDDSDDEDDTDSDDDDDDDDDEEDGDENPLESEAEIAADYLEELLDIADLDGDIDTYIEGDRAHVSIVSESNVLVGPNGQVLDALQELTRLAVMTDTGDRSRLMLDIAGFRERRRKELLVLATDAVQEVKDSKGPVALAPMNPFERKIVHDAVAAAGFTSESEGEDPRRHVVVLPSA